MQYFPTVYIFKREAHLHKPIHNLCFCEEFIFGSFFLDLKREITHVTEFHDNYEKPLLCKTSFVSNYINMRKIFQ